MTVSTLGNTRKRSCLMYGRQFCTAHVPIILPHISNGTCTWIPLLQDKHQEGYTAEQSPNIRDDPKPGNSQLLGKPNAFLQVVDVLNKRWNTLLFHATAAAVFR